MMPAFGREPLRLISQKPNGSRTIRPIRIRRNACVAGSMLEAFTQIGVKARNAVPSPRMSTALPWDTGLTGSMRPDAVAP